MSEQIEKMFEKFTNNLPIEITSFYVENELTQDQEKILKNAITSVFEKNFNGEIKKFGGKFNEEIFQKLEEEIKKRLESPIFKPFAKDLEKLIKKWKELQKKVIDNSVFAIVPVKDLPVPTVTFLTVPRIVWPKGKLDKMEINKNEIAYAGEVKALVTRTVLYGKMSKSDPLFAPHIGPLDLADYKPDPKDKTPKSEIPKFVHEIVNCLERASTKNHVTRYDAQYERHGEPICDFLMKDDDLKKTLVKLTSALDTKRQASNAAIPAMILPLISSSMVLITDESSGSKKYEIAFESLIKLAAASYETPNVKKGAALNQIEAAAMTQAAKGSTPSGTGIGALVPQGPAAGAPPPAPPQPKLAVWTEDELAEEAKKRGVPASNLPVWTEEELEKEAKNRGTGVNLPMWTEEELEKETARRQGSFNIPEWKEDGSSINCPKCGYVCRPGWPTCPICGADLKGVGASSSKAPEAPKAAEAPKNAEPPKTGEAPKAAEAKKEEKK